MTIPNSSQTAISEWYTPIRKPYTTKEKYPPARLLLSLHKTTTARITKRSTTTFKRYRTPVPHSVEAKASSQSHQAVLRASCTGACPAPLLYTSWVAAAAPAPRQSLGVPHVLVLGVRRRRVRCYRGRSVRCCRCRSTPRGCERVWISGRGRRCGRGSARGGKC
jgi:hypothetical protein